MSTEGDQEIGGRWKAVFWKTILGSATWDILLSQRNSCGEFPEVFDCRALLENSLANSELSQDCNLVKYLWKLY